ncbi:unnamed protein product, partial [Mesorhabditis spiculigera]
MKGDPSGDRIDGNTTTNVFDYSQSERSALIWAVGVGTTLATFPINHLMIKIGARWVCLFCIVISALASLLSPFVAAMGLWPFLIVRFLQGVAYAADFAAIGAVIVRWVPITEYAIFVAIMTAFTPISSFVTDSASGFFCETSLGWRASFYAHAVFGFVMAGIWLLLFSNQPEKNKFVGAQEVDLIHKDKCAAEVDSHKEVPYLKILKSVPIWAVWANAFGEHVTTSLLLTYAPIFFNSVLAFDIGTTGILASLIGLVQIPFKIVCAICSDKITFISEKNKMLIFNFISVGSCGVLCCLLGFLGKEARVWSVGTFFLFSTLSSANSGGFYKCAIYVARQYSHFVISAIQFMKCLALFVCPAIVAVFVHDDNNLSQWRIVFLISGIYMMISHIIFWIFHTDVPADFTNVDVKPRRHSSISLTEPQAEKLKA